jgi:xanthine dehydrogenase accessory factor
MFDFAVQALEWLDHGRAPVLIRVIELIGMSSQSPGGATLGVVGEPRIGRLLDGAVSGHVNELIDVAATGIHDVTIDDQQAAEAGLACGGRARLFVQAAADVPVAAWTALAARVPVCLVTDLDGERVGHTTWFTVGSSAADPRHDPEIVRWFGRGATATAVMRLADGASQVLVGAYWPTPRLLVVGDGLLAAALEQAARVLEWDSQALNEAGAAVTAVQQLGRNDALLVLSHDRDTDGPVLAAALASETGYVGALGSRRTQQARAEWLRERGVTEDALEQVHGPAGLDIGARTPGEIAVSIVAEIISARTGAGGRSLRDLRGPIHVDGLNTSPPRY